jgi:hypothetical protein
MLPCIEHAPHALLLIDDPHTYTVAAARACARGTSSLLLCCLRGAI